MPSLSNRFFHCGDVDVDLAQRSIARNGDSLFPRPRTFDLLVYLIERRDRVVSREELLSALWPNAVVTPNSLTQCVNEVRKLLGDDPHNPRFIRTAAKAGYQFIGPVEEKSGYLEQITSVEVEYEEQVFPTLPLPGRRAIPWKTLMASCLALAAVAAVTFWWRAHAESRPPGSVVVLPFTNETSSADLDWLREGLPDMLITNLSRAPGMNLLGREEVRSLLGSAVSGGAAFDQASVWGRQHGVGVLISGSFARLGDKIRISAHIYETATGRLLHSESFAVSDVGQILTNIDLLSLGFANELGRPVPPGMRLDALTILMTPSIEAYRNYVLGLESADAVRPEEALAFLQKAIDLDPQFAMAHARIGYIYTNVMSRPADAKPSLERAFRLSSRLTIPDRMRIAAWYALANSDFEGAIKAYRQLIDYNPRDVEAYARLGSLLSGERRDAEAIAAFERGLAIDPNSASTWNLLSGAHARTGNGEAAVLAAQRYTALAPREANAWDTLGLAQHVAGRFQESERAYQRALALKSDFFLARIHLAGLNYQRGKLTEARKDCMRFLDHVGATGERTRGVECLAIVAHRLGRDEEAERLGRESGNGGGATAFIHLDRGDTGPAAELLRAAQPSHDYGRRRTARIPLVLEGRVAIVEGRVEQGLQLIRLGLEQPLPYWYWDWFEDALGDALLGQRRYREAIDEYRRALNRLPFVPMTHYHLAVALQASGDRRAACAEYRNFTNLWKDADAGLPELAASKRFCPVPN